MNEFFEKIPEYTGKAASPYIYNVGGGMKNDLAGTTDEDCYLRLVEGTNAEEYRAYIKKLTECGYTKTYENETCGNIYTELSGACRLYVYYTDTYKQTRIINDRSSVPLSEFSYDTSKESPDAEIYQYALFYDPQNGHSPTTTNCGMLFIVKLADNSLYMYDGGDLLQCSDRSVEGMISFMHRITGTKSGEKIRIAAWHISHAHNDHFCGCAKLINRYHSELNVERFMFNFPSSSVRRPDTHYGEFKDIINKYCQNALFLKLHTGQRIQLANAAFDVLYTCEDAVRADDPNAYPLRDYNCTSTIVKMTIANNSIMWLGDTNTETENIVSKVYSPQIWKSDVVQVAHHCFNYLSTLYPLINAPYAMLPNTPFGAHTPENLPKLADVLKCLSAPENITYSDVTSGFVFKDGKYIKILEEERVGNDYDFSGF